MTFKESDSDLGESFFIWSDLYLIGSWFDLIIIWSDLDRILSDKTSLGFIWSDIIWYKIRWGPIISDGIKYVNSTIGEKRDDSVILNGGDQQNDEYLTRTISFASANSFGFTWFCSCAATLYTTLCVYLFLKNLKVFF